MGCDEVFASVDQFFLYSVHQARKLVCHIEYNKQKHQQNSTESEIGLSDCFDFAYVFVDHIKKKKFKSKLIKNYCYQDSIPV